MDIKHWFTKKQSAQFSPASEKAFQSPVPSQMIPNGEFLPMPQTRRQARVEALNRDAADLCGEKPATDRRAFLKTSSGMAAAFLAVNQVFGDLFSAHVAEAADAQGAMDQTVRRIVTGRDAQGRSVFVEDTSTVMKGVLHELWVTDSTPAKIGGAPDLGTLPVDLEPPRGGTVMRFVRLQSTAGMSREDLERVYAKAFEGIHASHARVDTRRNPAMHTTRTLDYAIVLSGEVTLLLDVGERKLKPFDVVIQRGTNHGWVNEGPAPALIAFALIDGQA